MWELDSPMLVQLQPELTERMIIRRMLVVAGKIWCVVHRSIYIINPITLQIEVSIYIKHKLDDKLQTKKTDFIINCLMYFFFK